MKHFIGVTLKDYLWKKVLTLNARIEGLAKAMIDDNNDDWLKKSADESIEILIKEHAAKDKDK